MCSRRRARRRARGRGGGRRPCPRRRPRPGARARRPRGRSLAVAVVVSFRSVCSNADNLCLCDTKTTHFPQKRGLLTGDCATYSYT